MVSTGAIKSRLFSIFLGSHDAGWGTILFGGIDRSQYKGALSTLNLNPRIPKATSCTSFFTNVTNVGVSANGTSSSLFPTTSQDDPSGALLDSGSTDLTLRSDVYSQIVTRLPYLQLSGLCSRLGPDDSTKLTFGGKVNITINAKELFVPAFNSTTNVPILNEQGELICTSLLDQGYPYIIGQAVLTSMYVVSDLDNGQVSIAQAGIDASRPANIVEVPAGLIGVARAVGGNIATASKNPDSVATAISGTISSTLMTLATPIGTATGVDAVPTDGHVNTTAVATLTGRFTSRATASSCITSTVRTYSTPGPTSRVIAPTSSATPGRGTCSKDGALVCNGDILFPICNLGEVIWHQGRLVGTIMVSLAWGFTLYPRRLRRKSTRRIFEIDRHKMEYP